MHQGNVTGCGHADICVGDGVLLRSGLVGADSLEAEQNGEAQCGQQTAAGLLLRKVFKYVVPLTNKTRTLMFKNIAAIWEGFEDSSADLVFGILETYFLFKLYRGR